MIEDWEECILGEVLVKMCNGSSAKQFNEEVGYPISRIETIWNETIDLNRVKYVMENDVDFVEKYKLRKNDILLSHINSDAHLGKTAIIKSERYTLIHGINILLLRPSSLLIAEFLLYQLRFLKVKGAFIDVASRSVNQSSVNQQKLNKFKITLFPLPIQRAIVTKLEELFSDLDSGIDDLKKAQAQLKIYRQAVLKKAFEGEFTKEWRAQQTDLPTAEELLEQIKEERLKHYEQKLEGWKNAVEIWEENGKEGKKPRKPQAIKKLEDMKVLSNIGLLEIPECWCYLQSEYLSDFITKETTPKSSELSQDNGDIPFVKVYNLTFTGELDFRINPTFVSNDIHSNFLNRSITLPNDILMNIVGPPLGKVSIVPETYPEWNINQAIVRFRPYPSIISKYLANFLMMKWTIHQVSKKAKATAGQFNLTLEICREIFVPVCSLKEQHQIVREIESRLSVCDNVEQSIAESLEKAKALRQSILKKAFEGKLLTAAEIAKCKQEKDYEPASVLLAKIAQSRAEEQEKIKAEKALQKAKSKKGKMTKKAK